MEVGQNVLTILVRNLADDVTGEQLGDRFGKLGEPIERSEVVFKNNHTMGFVSLRIQQAANHGEQYQIRLSVLDKCIKTFNNTLWHGKKITVEEGREHFSRKIEREKKLLQETRRKEKCLELDEKLFIRSPPYFSPEETPVLKVKAQRGAGYVFVKSVPESWEKPPSTLLATTGRSRHFARKYMYDSIDSDDEAPIHVWKTEDLEKEIVDLNVLNDDSMIYGEEASAPSVDTTRRAYAAFTEEKSKIRHQDENVGQEDNGQGFDTLCVQSADKNTVSVEQIVEKHTSKKITSSPPRNTALIAAYSEEEMSASSSDDRSTSFDESSSNEEGSIVSTASSSAGDYCLSRSSRSGVSEDEGEQDRPENRKTVKYSLLNAGKDTPGALTETRPVIDENKNETSFEICQSIYEEDLSSDLSSPTPALPASSEEDWSLTMTSLDLRFSKDSLEASRNVIEAPDKVVKHDTFNYRNLFGSIVTNKGSLQEYAHVQEDYSTKNILVESAEASPSDGNTLLERGVSVAGKKRMQPNTTENNNPDFNFRNLFKRVRNRMDNPGSNLEQQVTNTNAEFKQVPKSGLMPFETPSNMLPAYMNPLNADPVEVKEEYNNVHLEVDDIDDTSLVKERATALALVDVVMGDGEITHASGLDDTSKENYDDINENAPLGRQSFQVNNFNQNRYDPFAETSAILELVDDSIQAHDELESIEMEKTAHAKKSLSTKQSKGADDQKEDGGRFFWKSSTTYWTDIFKEAASKEDANIATAAASNFSLSSMFENIESAAAKEDPAFASESAGNNFTEVTHCHETDMKSSLIAENDAIDEYLEDFIRTKSVDEIAEEWKDLRHDLTVSFKRKHKSARKLVVRGSNKKD